MSNGNSIAKSAAALLSTLALLASTRFCGVLVTRSSIDGFDVWGLVQGGDLDEVAELLASLKGRVQAGLKLAAGALKNLYGLTGSFKVTYGVSRSIGKPVARISLTLHGPISTRDLTEAMGRTVIELRDVLLAAEQRGQCEIVAMMFG